MYSLFMVDGGYFLGSWIISQSDTSQQYHVIIHRNRVLCCSRMCLLLSVVWWQCWWQRCQWHGVLLSTDGGTLGWNSPQLVTRATSPELTLLPPGRGRLRAVACDWCVQSSAPADCLARYHIYIVLSWACDPSAGREIWFVNISLQSS